MSLVFGFRHVQGIPSCPCGDPGNYACMEQDDSDPLSFTIRCWCGGKLGGRFDNDEERAAFLRANGVKP